MHAQVYLVIRRQDVKDQTITRLMFLSYRLLKTHLSERYSHFPDDQLFSGSHANCQCVLC